MIFYKLISLFAFLPFTAFAATMSWNADKAIAMGNGCNSRTDALRPVDTFFISNGNDISVVMSNISINLPGGAGLAMRERKNCSLRIPGAVATGYYVGEFRQQLYYGVTKTAGSTGALSTRASIFGRNLSPLSVSFPYGQAINKPLAVATRSDLFLVSMTKPKECETPAGEFRIDLSVSGQRNSDWEDLILYTDSLDLRLDESVYSLVLCPRNSP